MNSFQTFDSLTIQEQKSVAQEALLEYRSALSWWHFISRNKIKRAAADGELAWKVISAIGDRTLASASTATISNHSASIQARLHKLNLNKASFLDKLLQILEWMLEHKDQILDLIDLFT